MGRSTFARELELGQLYLTGDARLARTIDRWLPADEYAQFEGIPALAKDRPQQGRLRERATVAVQRSC